MSTLPRPLEETDPELAELFLKIVNKELPVIVRDTEVYVANQAASKKAPYVAPEAKVGRNDPCTCGSGKKFKKCCGK